MWYQNIRSPSFSFVTIHASEGQTDGRMDRQTDGQTDGENSDSNTVHCSTRSCTVKMSFFDKINDVAIVDMFE